jgi:hypothetical protein
MNVPDWPMRRPVGTRPMDGPWRPLVQPLMSFNKCFNEAEENEMYSKSELDSKT